ncbi:hypothetical protein [Swingsia samuiensis]|uniref:hypothetical protein n=1 Tax=Swingsia samuiensis TaxID=1293412 RepID=UPI0015E89D13|nr:hypothetical protein [Swingsia samuiensis]
MGTIIFVNAADVSLFHVALRELGKADDWFRIAQINGMDDPDLSWIENVVPIKIPSN